MKIVVYTLLSHIIIFIIVVFGFMCILPSEWLDNTTAMCLLFIMILGFYFLSGYIIADKNSGWHCYFAIAAIGVVLWGWAYMMSPDSLQYKKNPDAGSWFYYRLFTTPIYMPFGFVDGFDTMPVKTQMYLLPVFPVLASTMQYLGAIFKKERFKEV